MVKLFSISSQYLARETYDAIFKNTETIEELVKKYPDATFDINDEGDLVIGAKIDFEQWVSMQKRGDDYFQGAVRVPEEYSNEKEYQKAMDHSIPVTRGNHFSTGVWLFPNGKLLGICNR